MKMSLTGQSILKKKAPFSIRKVVCKGPYIIVGTLWQELGHISGPKVDPELLDLIDYLLLLDHMKRPTAVEAPEHPCLRHDVT